MEAQPQDKKLRVLSDAQSCSICLDLPHNKPSAEVPGLAVHDDAAWISYIRERGVANFHPVGTCRMGRGPEAVVDPRLHVHGIRGLRVADASIMPQICSGNTNAPTIMIAEKAAEMILEDARIAQARLSPA